MAVGACTMRQHPTTWQLVQGWGGRCIEKDKKSFISSPISTPVGEGVRTNICSTIGNRKL